MSPRFARRLGPLRAVARAAGLAAAAGSLVCPSVGFAQDLFVVSQFTATVLRYDGGDGTFLETFVETITDGFSNPGGMALRTATGELYVTSTGTGEIWRYTAATGAVLTPPAASGLIAPGSAAFDAAGDTLYFLAAGTSLSSGTDALMKLAISSGNVSTLASDDAANFSALAVNGSEIFVSDALNGRVLRFSSGGGGGGGTTVISGLVFPGAILFRSATEMVVAETGADRVVEYTFDGSSWSFQRELLAPSSGVNGPFGLALAPDGTLSVSGSFSNDVVSVDLTSLVVSPLVAAGAGGLGNAMDLAWDGATLLAVSPLSNAVVYFDASGNPTGTTARGLSAPSDSGMTLTPSGNLLVGSLLDNDVVEYDAATGAAVGTFFDACPTSLAAPFDQVVGADENLYVSCPSSQGIFRFDGGTGNPLGFFVTGGSGGLVTPRGLAFGSDGNLFVASATGEVLEYDGTTGAFIGVFVDTTGNGGGAMDPYGLAFHGGSLFVASFFPDEVKQFDATAGAFVQTFVSSGAGGLSGPTNLAFGPDGDLYVTSYHDDAVRRYDGTDGSFVEVFVASGSGGLSGPFDLQFVPEPTVTTALASGALLLWALYALQLRASRGVSR